ncbi:MAG: hypothetical protein LQ338_007461 [Usnochroma carphineum]|nr:MAG: hypothetical protein LQ338_007461 [Usnochroma carphineum]
MTFQAVSVGATPPVWMAVEVATEVSEGFKNMEGVDGIIGLGFRDLNFVFSFMERLIGATNPTLPVFTVDFDPKRPHSKPTVEVGKVDPEKYNGSLAYAPVNNKDGWWAVDNVSFEVGGQPIKPKQTMIIDTGGSGIISVTMEVAKAYHKTLGSNGTWFYPCTSAVQDLTLHLGNGTTVYTADQLKASTNTPGRGFSLLFLVVPELPTDDITNAVCTSSVRGNNGTYGNVAAAFFRTNYVVFDYEKPAIHFAPHT